MSVLQRKIRLRKDAVHKGMNKVEILLKSKKMDDKIIRGLLIERAQLNELRTELSSYLQQLEAAIDTAETPEKREKCEDEYIKEIDDANGIEPMLLEIRRLLSSIDITVNPLPLSLDSWRPFIDEKSKTNGSVTDSDIWVITSNDDMENSQYDNCSDSLKSSPSHEKIIDLMEDKRNANSKPDLKVYPLEKSYKSDEESESTIAAGISSDDETCALDKQKGRASKSKAKKNKKQKKLVIKNKEMSVQNAKLQIVDDREKDDDEVESEKYADKPSLNTTESNQNVRNDVKRLPFPQQGQNHHPVQQGNQHCYAGPPQPVYQQQYDRNAIHQQSMMQPQTVYPTLQIPVSSQVAESLNNGHSFINIQAPPQGCYNPPPIMMHNGYSAYPVQHPSQMAFQQPPPTQQQQQPMKQPEASRAKKIFSFVNPENNSAVELPKQKEQKKDVPLSSPFEAKSEEQQPLQNFVANLKESLPTTDNDINATFARNVANIVLAAKGGVSGSTSSDNNNAIIPSTPREESIVQPSSSLEAEVKLIHNVNHDLPILDNDINATFARNVANIVLAAKGGVSGSISKKNSFDQMENKNTEKKLQSNPMKKSSVAENLEIMKPQNKSLEYVISDKMGDDKKNKIITYQTNDNASTLSSASVSIDSIDDSLYKKYVKDVVETDNKKVTKEVGDLLNELTPLTYKDLSIEIINKALWKDADTLPIVVELIFLKAIEEPNFIAMYADLCFAINQSEQRMEKDKFERRFFGALVRKSQVSFEKISMSSCLKPLRDIRENIEKETNENKLIDLYEQLKEVKADLNIFLTKVSDKKKRYTLSLLKFLSHMYRISFLNDKLIENCIVLLLRNADDSTNELMVEFAIHLIESVGPYVASKDAEHAKKMDEYVVYLNKFKENVSNRVRFMILGLAELSQKKWVNEDSIY